MKKLLWTLLFLCFCCAAEAQSVIAIGGKIDFIQKNSAIPLKVADLHKRLKANGFSAKDAYMDISYRNGKSLVLDNSYRDDLKRIATMAKQVGAGISIYSYYMCEGDQDTQVMAQNRSIAIEKALRSGGIRVLEIYKVQIPLKRRPAFDHRVSVAISGLIDNDPRESMSKMTCQ